MAVKTWQDFVSDAKSRITEVSQEEFKQWLKDGKEMILVDVREPNEHAHSRIEGAVNVPRGVLEIEIDETVSDRNQPVVAYCGGGGRSAMAADVLQQMGYTTVYSLQGGYKAWSQAPLSEFDYSPARA